ncbi:hypothetical protein N7490_001525 [Penicillium lividum]|nr:hypothetical protein N7490_001525 [Penicillium lividum]
MSWRASTSVNTIFELVTGHQQKKSGVEGQPTGPFAVKKHLLWQGGHSLSRGSTTACGEEAPAKTRGRATWR